MGLFSTLKKLTATTQSAEIAIDLDEARAALAKAVSDLAAADAGYADSLLDDSEPASIKARTKVFDAGVTKDRATRLVAAFESKLAEAVAREREAARLAQYADAKAAVETAAHELGAAYPAACERILDLMRAVAKATDMATAANKNLPAGALSLEDCETIARGKAGKPRQIMSQGIIERWIWKDTRVFLNAGEVERVIPQGDLNEGYVKPAPGYVQLSPRPVAIKRRFYETTYTDAVRTSTPRRLVRELCLPGMFANESFFRPIDGYGAHGAESLEDLQKHIDKRGAKAPPPVIVTRTELQAIDEVTGEVREGVLATP